MPYSNRELTQYDFLAGGGEMGARIRAFDWSATALGSPRLWPQSLRTMLDIMLRSQSAIFVWWGPELIQFYNDAYRPILGSTKHPSALGNRGRVTWREIWDQIGPMVSAVMARGESTNVRDGLLVLERNGFAEEGYFDYAYSPIRDETGQIAGVFAACNETSGRVIGERRLATLRALGAASVQAYRREHVYAAATQALVAARDDVPFALIFKRVDDGAFVLVCAAGLEPSHRALQPAVWPLARLLAMVPSTPSLPACVLVDGLAQQLPPLGDGSWPQAPHSAVLLPLLRSEQSVAPGVADVLVLGLNPRLPYDEAYQTFHNLAASQIAASAASAQAIAESRQRAEQLAELDRAKSAFFSNVSHEFRTPMTLMLGPLEQILAKSSTPATVREPLHMVHRNGLRLLKMVNSLLDFSRIEAGRTMATFEATDLPTLTHDIANSFRATIEDAGLRYQLDVDPIDQPVWIDREMWEKIVLNLLSNAFKFTFDGTISVRLQRNDQTARLTVSDTGVGIASDQLAQIFERFHRVHGVKARTLEGSGIGLALVHELVKQSHGTIVVGSVLGQGTRFTVQVPLGSAHVPTADLSKERRPLATVDAQAFVQEAIRWLPQAPVAREPYGIRSEPPAAIDQRFASTFGARLLIADDNADMRAYLYDLLSPMYTISMVNDGAQALAQVERVIPDLLVCDVMMPGLDGHQLLSTIRGAQHLRHMPVLLVSARAGEDARIQGLTAGADDHLVKPFSALELLTRVGALLELRQIRQAADERYRGIVDQSFAGICEVTIEGRFVNANQAFRRIVDYSMDELRQRTVFELTHPQDLAKFRELLEHLVHSGSEFEAEQRYLRNNGPPIWVACRISAHRDSNDSIQSLIIIAMDITERRASEQELLVANVRVRALLSAAELGGWVWHFQSKQLSLDQNFLRLYGFDAVQGSTPEEHFDRIHPDDVALVRAAIQSALQTDRFFIRQYRVVWPDGTVHWLAGRGAVQRNADGVVEFMSGLVIDIDDFVAMEQALRESDQRKDEFLAMLGHELRNPLAPLVSAGTVLTRILPPDPRTDGPLATINRQLSHLTRLVDDLLDVSRINQRQIQLQPVPLDLASVVQQALETVDSLLHERQHELVLSLPAQPVFANVDRVRLVQCVTNLLTNAAKYTATAGRINVVLRGDREHAIIQVADNGMGLEPALLPHIFELFVQGNRSLERSQGGLGIGLSVVQRLVALSGGRVEARSPGPGMGSTFEICLPRVYAVAAVNAEPISPVIAKLRILVVDDNADAADSLAALLALDGHQTKTCYNGATVLETLAQFAPNIVLLDIGLPQIDGYEVARRIRATKVPVQLIALTGYGQEQDKRLATAAGFDAHLVKPVDFDALNRLLDQQGANPHSAPPSQYAG